MSIKRVISHTLLGLACFGMIIPRACIYAEQPAAAAITDIALAAQNTLQGRVLDARGRPVPHANISLQNRESTVVKTQTDEAGSFNVQSLQGGVYHLSVGKLGRNVRVWAPNTAPPTALDGLTVTLGTVQRGQGCTADSCTGTCGGTCAACGGGAMGFLMNPLVIGAAVAAAIAIPLAVSNNDDDDDAS